LFVKEFAEVVDLQAMKLVFEYKDYATTIPKSLNLENIENNCAEGYVLKYAGKIWKIKS